MQCSNAYLKSMRHAVFKCIILDSVRHAVFKGLEFWVSLVGDYFCAGRQRAEIGTSFLRRGRCHRARRWLHR